MKNIIIYNKVDTNKFGGKKSDDVINLYLEAQIDNSIFYGWNINDIIIGTNFDFEYKGIKNIKLTNICKFSGYNNKWYGLRELYSNHINEDCWIHDYDNWQISDIKDFPNFDGKVGGCTYVYNNEWNTASMFIKKDSLNILDYVYEFLEQNKHIPFDSDENAISYIRNVDEVKSYFSDLNQKFNVGMTQLDRRYHIAEKPVCVLGCKLFNKSEYEKFKTKYDYLNLIPNHLYDIVNAKSNYC
jgi:hypothetical protein